MSVKRLLEKAKWTNYFMWGREPGVGTVRLTRPDPGESEPGFWVSGALHIHDAEELLSREEIAGSEVRFARLTREQLLYYELWCGAQGMKDFSEKYHRIVLVHAVLEKVFEKFKRVVCSGARVAPEDLPPGGIELVVHPGSGSGGFAQSTLMRNLPFVSSHARFPIEISIDGVGEGDGPGAPNRSSAQSDDDSVLVGEVRSPRSTFQMRCSWATSFLGADDEEILGAAGLAGRPARGRNLDPRGEAGRKVGA